MKYAVLVPDGMADYPVKELGDRTPLEAAKTPHMDSVASQGICGLVNTIPKGLTPGSDVANLSILGYDPVSCYAHSGRGPLEAANLGLELEDGDIAMRTSNVITASEGTMVDYSAGHISSQEAARLIQKINKRLGSDAVRFYPGVSYRNIMVVKHTLGLDISDLQCSAPHDILSQPIAKHLPRGKAGDFLNRLMQESVSILEGDEINQVRLDLGENPATMIWLWGAGGKPHLVAFKEKFGLQGSVISAVDLVKGIGRAIGLEVIKVEGATAYYDTNYQGKAAAAIDQLKKNDFVFVHVEAADEAGHNADLQEKILAIERFDQFIVGPVLEHLKKQKEFRVMVLPDHATPLSLRTHTDDPVPFCMMGKHIVHSGAAAFSERVARASDKVFASGSSLMEHFLSIG